MNARPIVKRLRPYTSQLTWAQLQSLTKQTVIDAFIADNDPLSADEIEQIGYWGWKLFNWLKQEWIATQHQDFVKNRYLPAFRAAINPSLSSFTVRQVYEYTLSEGLSEDTATALHKKAVIMYRKELKNG